MQIELVCVNLRNSFMAGQSISNEMYTANINATNNLFNGAQSKISLAYNNIIAAGYSFVLQITNTLK